MHFSIYVHEHIRIRNTCEVSRRSVYEYNLIIGMRIDEISTLFIGGGYTSYCEIFINVFKFYIHVMRVLLIYMFPLSQSVIGSGLLKIPIKECKNCRDIICITMGWGMIVVRKSYLQCTRIMGIQVWCCMCGWENILHVVRSQMCLPMCELTYWNSCCLNITYTDTKGIYTRCVACWELAHASGRELLD